jgi:solute carrier family 25 protein 39/40
MPGAWGRDHPTTSTEPFATFEKDTYEDQGNERFHGDDLIPGVTATMAMTGDNEHVVVDITAGQKMLSAMSGSLLTSLLGESSLPLFDSLY